MKKFFNKLCSHIIFNKYSFINSLKAVFACLIGLILAHLFHLVQPQWVLISTLIVMAAQYRLGGAMMKGYSRLFATALGSSVAAAILFFFSAHLIIIYLVLFLFIALFIYLAGNSTDYSYAYALGAVTMVVIVVSNNPQLQNALDRLIEIMLGVIIAILVSRFVFPIQAEKILYKNIANTLRLLKEVYQLFIREDKTFSINSMEINLEENIIQNLTKQPVLLKEACIETYSLRKQQFKYTIILRLERRLLRSIYMLHYTLRLSLKNFKNIVKMEEFKQLHHDIVIVIEDLANKIENKNFVISECNLKTQYEDIIFKLRATFDQYSFEEKNKIHAFIFCLGHVIFILNRLQKIVLEIEYL